MQNILTLGSMLSNVGIAILIEDKQIGKRLGHKVIDMKEDLRKHFNLEDEVSPEDFPRLYIAYCNEMIRDSVEAHKRITKDITEVKDLDFKNNVSGFIEANSKVVVELGKLLKGE